MQSRTMLTIGAALSLGFGASFLAAPIPVLALYGVAADAATALMARFFGVGLFHIGGLLWLTSDVSEPTTLRAIMLASVLGAIVGLLVSLQGVLAGTTNALGWSTVAIYGLLMLGYGAFVVRPAAGLATTR